MLPHCTQAKSLFDTATIVAKSFTAPGARRHPFLATMLFVQAGSPQIAPPRVTQHGLKGVCLVRYERRCATCSVAAGAADKMVETMVELAVNEKNIYEVTTSQIFGSGSFTTRARPAGCRVAP